MARKSIIIDGMDGKEISFTESADKLSMTIRIMDSGVEQVLGEIVIDADGYEGAENVFNKYGRNGLVVERPVIEETPAEKEEMEKEIATIIKSEKIVKDKSEQLNTKPYEIRNLANAKPSDFNKDEE